MQDSSFFLEEYLSSYFEVLGSSNIWAILTLAFVDCLSLQVEIFLILHILSSFLWLLDILNLMRL